MVESTIGRVVDQLRITLTLADEASLPDAQLLARFIDNRDEGAFAALARRFGPMVMGVCRRVTRNREDAEDAFQATFLVLARKAAAIKSRRLVANWLYGVAHKTAQKAYAMAAKRRRREIQVSDISQAAMEQEHGQNELLALLDQELSCLPDKYRIPIVLCDLQGLAHKEAAVHLGIAEKSVSARISRGRRMLAKRLTRHGPAVPSAGLALLFCQKTAAARIPTGLLVKTIKGAITYASGRAPGAIISAQAAGLAEGMLKSMLLSKLKLAVILIAISALSLFGAGAFAHVALAQRTDATPMAAQPIAKKAAQASPRDAQSASKQDEKAPKKYVMTGFVRLEGTGAPISDVDVAFQTGHAGYQAQALHAKTGRDGRYSLELQPGQLMFWRLDPPTGFWSPTRVNSFGESFVLSAAEPVRHKDFIVRRGIAWDFQLIRKAPLGRQYIIVNDNTDQFFAIADDAGHAVVTLPGEGGKRTVNVTDAYSVLSLSLEWESGFRADHVKSVAPAIGFTGGFSLTDSAGKKATISGNGLAQPVLDKGKPILRVNLTEPDPKMFGELTGRIVDRAGRPVVGAQVALAFSYPKHGSSAMSKNADKHIVLTDAQGVYRIQSIPRSPNGQDEFQLILAVTKTGLASQDTRPLRFDPPGDAPQKVADIRLQPGNIIRGTVVDADGRPAVGVWIEAVGHYSIRSRFTKTDDAGKFTVRDLPEGAIGLSFGYGKFYANERLVAETDPKPVLVKLKPIPKLPRPATRGFANSNDKKPAAKFLPVGVPAPEWDAGPWTDGRRRKVTDYRDKVVFLDFWDIGSGSNAHGLAMFEKLRAKYEPRGVVFLALHTPGDSESTVRRLLEIKKIPLVFAFDRAPAEVDNDRNGVTAERYAVIGYPTYVLIDRAGKIAFHSGDPSCDAALAKTMKDLGFTEREMTEETTHQVIERFLDRTIERVLVKTPASP